MAEMYPECLNVRECVFLRYNMGQLFTAPKKPIGATVTGSPVYGPVHKQILNGPLRRQPLSGKVLKITWWHDALPVRIEAEFDGQWVAIFEDKLEDLQCRAGCHKEGM
jgi:hypothetical protein